MAVAALIVAAGTGVRAGRDLPKQYVEIGGRPVLRRTVEIFLSHRPVDRVQVVIGPGQEQLAAKTLDGLDIPAPVIGGATRQQSVMNGLAALSAHMPPREGTVLIHDAARPFLPVAVIDRVLNALASHAGAIPALAVADTLKRAHDGLITATVARADLFAAQTPQGFDFDTIRDAHQKAASAGRHDFTDDAAIAEWSGHKVAVVEGDARNIKLTTADDLDAADRHFARQAFLDRPDVRVGQGFDVHAFVPGDHVILCGVRVPHDRSLLGHSDADVGMHALTDAILGALAMGDIGSHFPPSDPKWKGAASEIFLRAAIDLVHARGGVLAHGDVTLICERPKIRAHVDAMRATLAGIAGVPVERIAVKATTSERLGFTGRGEGIAALATATVRLPAG